MGEAIVGALVGGLFAAVAGVLTGILLFKLEGKRLKRQWEREDRVRAEDRKREAISFEMELLLEQKRDVKERQEEIKGLSSPQILSSEIINERARLELELERINKRISQLAAMMADPELGQ